MIVKPSRAAMFTAAAMSRIDVIKALPRKSASAALFSNVFALWFLRRVRAFMGARQTSKAASLSLLEEFFFMMDTSMELRFGS